MKRFVKILVPVLFLMLGVGFLAFFQFYLKDKIDTVDVLTAKNHIDFKQKIKASDLTIKRVRVQNVVKDGFKSKDVNKIVGKYASIAINKGVQIYPSLLDKFNLVPNKEKGEFVAPIPNNWLYAVPGSLRKAYIADFYVVPTKDQAMLSNLVNSPSNNNSNNDKSKQPITTNSQMDSAIQDIQKPILTNVRVSSVKDRDNHEIKTTSPTSKDSAMSSGVISTIEIIATQDMLDTIRKYTDKGYKIYVVYQFDR